MVKKEKLRIADLLQTTVEVSIAEGKVLPVRPLNLSEMLTLFMGYRDVFLNLYSQAVSDGGIGYASFLAAAPDLVAKIIALASDTEGQEEDIAKLPVTVQLIALNEVWKLSVPDPKKAAELLSEVTARLRKLQEERAVKQTESDSQKTLSPQ